MDMTHNINRCVNARGGNPALRRQQIESYDEIVTDRLEAFSCDTFEILDSFSRKCPEAKQLRDYLRRMRRASLFNTFAGPWEFSTGFRSVEDIYIDTCRNGEDSSLRSEYIEWATYEEIPLADRPLKVEFRRDW
jgi:hypothetical protein